MIVISGALVLVALVLLVIGIAAGELPFVYASIIVSLVSLVFLVVGILQRRGETLPEQGLASDDEATEPVVGEGDGSSAGTAVQPVATDTPPIADSTDAELEARGTVLVVTGRPRYHVTGCRYLTGKAPEPVEVREAREDGFTPCGVCKPDAALVAQQDAPLSRDDAARDDAPVGGEPETEPEVFDVVPVPVRRAARRPAATPSRVLPEAQTDQAQTDQAQTDQAQTDQAQTDQAQTDQAQTDQAPTSEAQTDQAPTGQAPTDGAVGSDPEPDLTGTAPVRAARRAPARTARPASSTSAGPVRRAAAAKTAAGQTAEPSTAALLAAESTPEAASATRTGSVVVIPERGRFHLPQCRYVRGVGGAQVLTRDAAGQQGYAACGVCKP